MGLQIFICVKFLTTSSLLHFVTVCIFIGWPAYVLVAGRFMKCLSGKFDISSPSYCLFISNKPRAKERNTRLPDVILFQVVGKILPKQKFHIWKINLQGKSFPLFYSRFNMFRSKWPSLWITTIPAGNNRLTILKYKVFFFPGATTPIGGCILQPCSGL